MGNPNIGHCRGTTRGASGSFTLPHKQDEIDAQRLSLYDKLSRSCPD
jgi:hypothetical protein